VCSWECADRPEHSVAAGIIRIKIHLADLHGIQLVLKLDLRHLQMLEAISQARTLKQAAERLHVSPSALTHRVREAERRLGVSLLSRDRRHPSLTAAGDRVLRTAVRCLRELEAAESEAGSAQHRSTELVRVGASTLSGYEWLPDLLRRLESTHPWIDVEIALDVSLDPVTAVKERAIDIAIMPARIRLAAVRSRKLFRDEMVAVLPSSHPKSVRPYLQAQDLADEPYVTDGITPERGREYERLFEPSGVRPRRVLRAGHTAAVIALVQAALGVTILARRAAAPYLAGANLTAVPLTRNGLYLTWYAVMRAGAAKSSAVRIVTDSLATITKEQGSGSTTERAIPPASIARSGLRQGKPAKRKTSATRKPAAKNHLPA
jgi:LysR family transcriptional regulator for metE and metH